MYFRPNIDDSNDPELKGRIYNKFKGKYSSRATDPWMETRYKVDDPFLTWLIAERAKRGGNLSPANIKAEIRNDYVRAGDLWQEYQESLGLVDDTTDLPVRPSLLSADAIAAIARENKQRAKNF